ncbi:MAG TPA: hypothetical protein VE011_01080 [Candidatus Dormibacteraeota bacterium]|nr:hypothetical protein [Candidatus Dormibacteraeota bacterium]
MRSEARRGTLVRRLPGAVLGMASLIILVAANAPASLAPGAILDLNESGGGASSGGGTGGTFLSDFGPLLLVGLAIAAVVLLAALVILVRTRGAVTPSSSSEGWWTCSNCGAGNMDGAARCHACSTWRTATPRPTPNT